MPNSSTKTCKDTELACGLADILSSRVIVQTPDTEFGPEPSGKYVLLSEVEEIIRLLRTGTWGEQVLRERAFQTLESYGVPRSRARFVANGIIMLVTRMNKEIASLRAQLAERDAEIKALELAYAQAAGDKEYGN